ncbi:response regulator, partial [bacterium]|nr:response regulator [bacterium]
MNNLRLALTRSGEPITILMVDDDPDDCQLVTEALQEAGLANELRFAEDGEELMDYLHHRGKFADPASSPTPDLILLDLNMPKMDGREALKEIKSNRKLKLIPIVVFTTSQSEQDILRSYDLGVNSYIVKPSAFSELVDVVKILESYWFNTVQLPPSGTEG